jgi:hypothetical protein
MARDPDNARTVEVPHARRKARAAARIALALAALCALACPKPPPPPVPEAPAPPAPAPPEAERFDPPQACRRVEAIEVRKSERRLVAECSGGVRIAFPVGLSREAGPKVRGGDERIPEGAYRIAARPRPSRFHRFILLDYPSVADAARALAAGSITPDVKRAIEAAHARGAVPPQDTPLGGGIGLHGEGERWRDELDLDWTEGCVAMSDAAIDLLAERAPVGTPVRISP